MASEDGFWKLEILKKLLQKSFHSQCVTINYKPTLLTNRKGWISVKVLDKVILGSIPSADWEWKSATVLTCNEAIKYTLGWNKFQQNCSKGPSLLMSVRLLNFKDGGS